MNNSFSSRSYRFKSNTQIYNKPQSKTHYYDSLLCSTGQKIDLSDHYRLVNMIGYDKLLSSMHKNTSNINKNMSEPKNVSLNDRFIPNRKLILSNYDRKDNQQNRENEQLFDPQCITITEIFNQEILGQHKNNQDNQSLFSFKNNNILRFSQSKKICEKTQNPFKIPMINLPQKVRRINKIPSKVLDAPALQDDFYLNLIDWSSSNQLAVGLGNCIYLWNAESSKVTKLCELQNDLVTSVGWALRDNYLSVGCNKGQVQVWDVVKTKMIRNLHGHQTRVGAVSWNSNILATGSRDKTILFRDLRTRRDYYTKLTDHSQQICGLKWSLDEQYLASGGNDNKVGVWSAGGQLINKFSDHKAAVKAIAWSPHQHGLLATGGGTADRMLRLRNIFTGQTLFSKDTGSQICNLAFSKQLHEIVSTHGYSENEINIWSYPKIKKIATLKGHSHRVLYLAMSPDGGTIVTGAGDQTLRFWNIFPIEKNNQDLKKHQQSIFSQGFNIR